MLQDISPKQFHNDFITDRAPQATDLILVCPDNQVLLTADNRLPQLRDIRLIQKNAPAAFTYLFAIDATAVYWLDADVPANGKLQYASNQALKTLHPDWLRFVGSTAQHLIRWYQTNRFCGNCGHRMRPAKTERALHCDNCGQTRFPAIAPAIIVGVTDHDELLMTKFLINPQQHTYSKHALISGYNEIGETLEDTVRREVHEEVGLAVTNIRYYASQPWGFSGSQMVGFFADLATERPITLERDELSLAKWYARENIPHDDTKSSLTWQMIEAFRHRQQV